jgi:hypothetical protein
MTFDPTRLGFIRLQDFELPDGVAVFEYGNHPIVSGAKDFLRLNLYLSLGGSYTTIWFGLLEPVFAEAKLEGIQQPEQQGALADLVHSYNEPLFSGYIDSADAAAVIFRALRVDADGRYSVPQELRIGEDGAFGCYVIEDFA